MHRRALFEHLLILLMAALPLSLAASARADLAPPPIEQMRCMTGTVPRLPEVDPGATDSRGRPIRAWPYCAPSTCETDADCEGGRTCSAQTIGLCVFDQEVPGGSSVRAVRLRGCEPDGTCLNMESQCEIARRCVAPGDAPAPQPAPNGRGAATEEEPPPSEEHEAVQAQVVEPVSSGCTCRAAGPRSGAHGALALGLLALLVVRRHVR